MELARNFLLGLHLIAMAGMLISLLISRRSLSPGVTHSATLALVTGIALVGVRYGLNSQDPAKWANVENTKITIKTLVVATVLFIGYKHKNKESVAPSVWWTMTGLVLLNVAIAVW